MTVFTPTYNRAHTLPRLFDSLVAQTVQDFEWLVVDDGSTDDTETVVKDFAGRAPFAVRYLHQENAGKHTASNRAVREAAGEVFWTVDSDDWLLPSSVETMLRHWHDVKDRTEFAAVTGVCQRPDGGILGDGLPQPVLDSNSLELRYRYKVRGDKAGFTRTDVMRMFPFPEGDHAYVPEGIVWNAIAARFQTRYVQEPVLVKDYQADGFTLGGTTASPSGMALFQLDLLDKALGYLARSPRDLLLTAANYSRFGLAAGNSPKQLRAATGSRRVRGLVTVTLPIGWALRRFRDRRA